MSSKSHPPAGKSFFFIIGAQRSGTTYLYELLEGHPEIAMAKPKRPEPKWFLDPTKAVLGPEAWEASLFSNKSARVLGEKGTSYIEHPEAAAAILKTFPEARFVVIVREPIARAISNYRFSVGNGLEKLPVEQALTPEGEKRSFDRTKVSASPYLYLKRGRYADYIEAWAKVVSSGRIYVMVLEELLRDRFLDGLCNFLGIAVFRPQNIDQIVNAAVEPMPGIPDGLRIELKSHFQEPNRRLEKILGHSLDVWNS